MSRSNEMKYAPVIIPTLCRYEHFVRCLESLRKNTWAEYTDVYIGLDYPAKETHRDGYQKIKSYLKGSFPEFQNLFVVEHAKNVGSGKNMRTLIELCSREHDRFIYAEDDLEFSPCFLQYMDLALQRYEDDESVAAVVGYSYPVKWAAAPGCTAAKQNFNCSGWGRGYWVSKRNGFVEYLRDNSLSKAFSSAFRSGCTNRMIDFALKDYVSFCGSGWSGKRGFLNCETDVAMRIYFAVKDKYAVMPLVSKVRNHGYDGSGECCQQIESDGNGDFCVDNYAFSQQPIDESTTFELIEDTGFDLKTNRDLLNDFDRVDPEEMKEVWAQAEKLAKLGRYGGALLAGKKVLKKALGKAGFSG